MSYVHMVIEIFTLSSQNIQRFSNLFLYGFCAKYVVLEIEKTVQYIKTQVEKVYGYFQIKKNFICVLRQRRKTN